MKVLAFAAILTGHDISHDLCLRAQLLHRLSELPGQAQVLCSPAQVPHLGCAVQALAIWSYFWQLKHCISQKPSLNISVVFNWHFHMIPFDIALSACSA